MKKYAQDNGIQNVIFHGRKPSEEMPRYYAFADAMIVTLTANPLVSLTLPAKVQSYMAAGKPILDVITGRELTNAVIVVTRYFGGVLLGTGGLVRAYQKASIEALEDAVIAEKKQGKEFSIITDYTGLGKIQYIAANEKVNIMDTLYTDNVNIIIVCDSEKYEAFTKKVIEVTAGKVNMSKAEDVVFYETKTCIQIVD